jgi:hypothetical protein
MLGVIVSALWEIVSWNSFAIPRAAWTILQSASA